jgi:hypothetical protein
VSPKLFILDACVLIDFVSADTSILRLVCDHVGELHVAAPVLDEVEDLDESAAASLGIRIVHPTLTTAMSAAARRGALSFQDWLCLLLAKEHGWTCVSNDGRLRRECSSEGVAVMWGLELVEELVVAGGLEVHGAMAVAQAIHVSNPRYVSKQIMRGFEAKLRKIRR